MGFVLWALLESNNCRIAMGHLLTLHVWPSAEAMHVMK